MSRAECLVGPIVRRSLEKGLFMRRIILRTQTCFVTLVLVWLIAITAVVAQQPAPATPGGAPARTYKNVQVLKDLPFALMNPTMHLISGQLGVGCTYCHIWEQWDREDKARKHIARSMMAMTAAINKTYFGGGQMVTCYTCHQGSPKATNMVALPVPPPPHWEAPEPTPPELPGVDEILGAYVKALGGEAALRKITSRVITGKQIIPTGPAGLIPVPGDVEIYQKAPNKTVRIARAEKLTVSDGFDGAAAWAQTATGAVNNLQEPDQSRARRQANFYEPLEFKQNYLRMQVAGIEKVGERDAYVVVGYPEGDNEERLFFDTETRLLLRRKVYISTGQGPSPYQVDFEDYRDVNGVKMPFLIRMNPATQRTELGTSSTITVTKIETNITLDDSRFVRPQPRTPPPPRGE